jgi:hypothetical protein
MTIYKVPIPENLYRRLQKQAKTSHVSIELLVNQALNRHLPPPVEDDLPPTLQAELEAMSQLSDDALWQIAESVMKPDKVALYDVILERLKSNQITDEGRTVLNQLREEAQALTLRKAHAYALLQSRGHQLPSLEELKRSHS